MKSKIVVKWTPVHGRSRKLVFEPRPDGDWARLEFELRESQWREVGFESVTEVSVTTPADTDSDQPVSEEGDADE
ncbi:hypothetical protein [Natronorubrum sp. FCH18a]|uniref:hypothetical protein n=1 Tax=Natronorubrum sp. FCH18a TaxID=3447018 RepID=UPI003F519795